VQLKTPFDNVEYSVIEIPFAVRITANLTALV